MQKSINQPMCVCLCASIERQIGWHVALLRGTRKANNTWRGPNVSPAIFLRILHSALRNAVVGTASEPEQPKKYMCQLCDSRLFHGCLNEKLDSGQMETVSEMVRCKMAWIYSQITQQNMHFQFANKCVAYISNIFPN